MYYWRTLGTSATGKWHRRGKVALLHRRAPLRAHTVAQVQASAQSHLGYSRGGKSGRRGRQPRAPEDPEPWRSAGHGHQWRVPLHRARAEHPAHTVRLRLEGDVAVPGACPCGLLWAASVSGAGEDRPRQPGQAERAPALRMRTGARGVPGLVACGSGTPAGHSGQGPQRSLQPAPLIGSCPAERKRMGGHLCAVSPAAWVSCSGHLPADAAWCGVGPATRPPAPC